MMCAMSRTVFLAGLTALTIFIFSLPTPRGFSISFLDVGQGDAIFIQSPTGVQVLVDGGASRAVLRELGARFPFFDRSLDAVVATHPDQDHIGGLVDVISRYRTGLFLESGVMSDTSVSHALNSVLIEQGIPRVLARRGMRILLGGGAYADILFPDRDVSGLESNTGSVIVRVMYGEHEFMLTGDSPKNIEHYLTSIYGSALESDVLKAGHHGSKTSSSEEFVQAVNPKYVIYSRGCDNRYGHPAPETVAIFKKFSIPTLDTCEHGTITFRSDGKMLRVSKR